MPRVLLEMEKLKNLNSGLGQFCLNLGNAFTKINHPDLEPVFYVPPACKGIFGMDKNYLEESILHRLYAPSSEFDIWHCLHQQSKYMPGHKKTKLILTIHDLNFLEKYKGRETKIKRMLGSIQSKIDRASAITVISKFTEEIVQNNLRIPKIPFKVIYNGNSLQSFDLVKAPEYAPLGPFIFTIGIIKPRKNFASLLPLIKNTGLFLVIAGNKSDPYAEEIIKQAQEMDVSDRLIMPGEVTSKEKFWLFNNCKAFVFPSFAEGFGLPVIEAMSLGKPAFLLNSSSLPEIGGDAAYYWNNSDPGHMKEVFKNGLKEFENNPEKSKQMIERASMFSWENAAKQYIKLYSELS